MGECALAAIMEGWMPMAMGCFNTPRPAECVTLAQQDDHRGLGRGRDAGITPLFAGMRTAALVRRMLWRSAVAAPDRARAKPLLVVSAEVAGEIVVVDPAKAQVIERIKVGPRPRGLKLTRDRRRVLVALAGLRQGAAATRRGAGFEIARQRRGPRRRRHRGPQAHEAGRHRARAVRRRPVARRADRVPVEQRDQRGRRHRHHEWNGQEEDRRRHRTAGRRDPPRRQGRLRGHARRQRALRDRSEDDEPPRTHRRRHASAGRSCSRRGGTWPSSWAKPFPASRSSTRSRTSRKRTSS